jgi:hypothetical protein
MPAIYFHSLLGLKTINGIQFFYYDPLLKAAYSTPPLQSPPNVFSLAGLMYITHAVLGKYTPDSFVT